MKDIFITVVVPFSKEGKSFYEFGRSLCQFVEKSYSNFEILLIDDGASEEKRKEALRLVSEFPGIRYLRLTKKVGIHVAVLAGLENSLGDVVAVLDPQIDTLKMLEKGVEIHLHTGKTLFGAPPKTKDSFLEMFLSRIFNFYCKRILKLDLPVTTHFRVFNRQSVNQIMQIRDRYPLLRLSSSTVGIESEPMEYGPEFAAYRRTEKVWDRINEGVEIILSTTKHPLRLLGRLGLLWAAVMLGRSIYLVSVNWSNVSSDVFLDVSFVFILAILYAHSEYLGRILEETQNRPLYQIHSERTSQVLVFDDKNVESRT